MQGAISRIWFIRHLLDQEQSQVGFFSEKTFFPSRVRNLFRVTILIKYHYAN